MTRGDQKLLVFPFAQLFKYTLHLNVSGKEKIIPVPVPVFLGLEAGASFFVLDELGLDDELFVEDEEVGEAVAPFWGY